MASTPSTTELLALIASAISAFGGLVSAWAAWSSARSAKLAQDSADQASRLGRLRELSAVAGSVVVEVNRIKERANQLRRAHRELAIFTGGVGGTCERNAARLIDDKEQAALEFVEDARLFTNGAQSLRLAPVEDIDRVSHRLVDRLEEVRAVREALDSELAEVNTQCSEYRTAELSPMAKPKL